MRLSCRPQQTKNSVKFEISSQEILFLPSNVAHPILWVSRDISFRYSRSLFVKMWGLAQRQPKKLPTCIIVSYAVWRMCGLDFVVDCRAETMNGQTKISSHLITAAMQVIRAIILRFVLCFWLSWLSSSYNVDKMLSVCLGVNQGGTNRSRCTQRLVTLHAQTY